MFDTLSDRLQGIFVKLRGQGRLSEAQVDAALREVRMALLEADVNFKVVKQFVARVRERAVGEEVLRSLTPAQQVIAIVHEELIATLGEASAPLAQASRPPTVILMAGLQGSGKTTTCAKLGRWLAAKGRTPLLVACDLQRPAAVRQLQILGEQAGLPVWAPLAGGDADADPVPVARSGLEEAIRLRRDLVIVDTAGRLAVDAEMMDQARAIRDAVSAHEILLVVDAMTGQDAVATAQAFQEGVDVTGFVLTKLDGDARGGAALSIRSVTGQPIKFAATGEKLADFDAFYPDRLAGRILGMGDVLSLIERAQETIDEEQTLALERKVREANWTLDDFLGIMQQVKRLGPLQQIMGMVPGMPRISDEDADIGEMKLKRTEAVIRSMTAHERRDPRVLNASRRRRIARGSGTTTRDVNEVMEQFDMMRKMMREMRKLTGGGGKGAMRQLRKLGLDRMGQS